MSQRNNWTQKYKMASKSLLQKRDQFVANRVGQTLKAGEVGVLFMGMLHQIDKYLPKDIGVEFLIHRLPFGSVANLKKTTG